MAVKQLSLSGILTVFQIASGPLINNSSPKRILYSSFLFDMI